MLEDKPRWWFPLEFRVGSLGKNRFPLLICITVESMGSSILMKCLVTACILIRYRFTNERHPTSIGTIGLPRLARALLTLIGSCRIYYVFNIKARFLSNILFLQSLC